VIEHQRTRRQSAHLGPSHPLAEVASRHCDHLAFRLGGVACGVCWERAIRDDERVVVEHGLSREVEPDPEFVDEIAVELACRGQRVVLTPVETRAAVVRLRSRQLLPDAIARRLHLSYAAVAALLGSDSVPACRRAA